MPAKGVTVSIDKCTAEHMSYNSGIFSSENCEEPCSLKNMIFWFSHTGSDKMNLTMEVTTIQSNPKINSIGHLEKILKILRKKVLSSKLNF